MWRLQKRQAAEIAELFVVAPMIPHSDARRLRAYDNALPVQSAARMDRNASLAVMN
jgi:hypothetical protein